MSAPVVSEYAVHLSCTRCVATAQRALRDLPGQSRPAEVSLALQTVLLAGSTPPAAVLAALSAAHIPARLVGRGDAGGAQAV